MNKRQRKKRDQNWPHPYASEYAGSHWSTSGDGVVYHITCSKEFANDPKSMAMMRRFIEAASKEPVSNVRKRNQL